MELPRKDGAGFAAIRCMARAERIARADLRTVLFAQGFTDSGIDNALARLIADGRVIKHGTGPNLEYELATEMRVLFGGGETLSTSVATSEPLVFKPLKGYDAMMRRGRDLRVWHPVPCASRPMLLEG